MLLSRTCLELQSLTLTKLDPGMRFQVSYSLNKLITGGYTGDYIGEYDRGPQEGMLQV